jgi:hypothetical protein
VVVWTDESVVAAVDGREPVVVVATGDIGDALTEDPFKRGSVVVGIAGGVLVTDDDVVVVGPRMQTPLEHTPFLPVDVVQDVPFG